MRYDIYNTRTGKLQAEDWPESAAREAENTGYHGTPAGNIRAVEHGAPPPPIDTD